MSTLALVFVNGSGPNGTEPEYLRIPLSGTLPAGGYLVVADVGTPVDPGAMVINFVTPTNSIQNGSPDGVILVDVAHGVPVDALSYEGAIDHAQVAGCFMCSELVEGSPASAVDDGVGNGSLIRYPNGHDVDFALGDWAFTTTPTPGTANTQTP
jgi:hypothetical protein